MFALFMLSFLAFFLTLLYIIFYWVKRGFKKQNRPFPKKSIGGLLLGSLVVFITTGVNLPPTDPALQTEKIKELKDTIITLEDENQSLTTENETLAEELALVKKEVKQSEKEIKQNQKTGISTQNTIDELKDKHKIALKKLKDNHKKELQEATEKWNEQEQKLNEQINTLNEKNKALATAKKQSTTTEQVEKPAATPAPKPKENPTPVTTIPEPQAVVSQPVQQQPVAEYFQNCTEMRKVYPNGVSSDHPAYAAKHDRDKDGWACER